MILLKVPVKLKTNYNINTSSDNLINNNDANSHNNYNKFVRTQFYLHQIKYNKFYISTAIKIMPASSALGFYTHPQIKNKVYGDVPLETI